jgi:PglD N-terminal domain
MIGAGGHAKVVIELVRAAGAYEIIGLIDLKLSGPPILDLPILGTDADLPRCCCPQRSDMFSRFDREAMNSRGER